MLSMKELFTRLTHDITATIQAHYIRGTAEYANLHFGKTTAESVELKRDLAKNIISWAVQGGDQQALFVTAEDMNVLIEACKICAANGVKVAYPMAVAHIVNPVLTSFNSSDNKQAYTIVGVQTTATTRPAAKEPVEFRDISNDPVRFKVRRELSFALDEADKLGVRVSFERPAKQPVAFTVYEQTSNSNLGNLGPVLSFTRSPVASPAPRAPVPHMHAANSPGMPTDAPSNPSTPEKPTRGLYKCKNYFTY